MYQPIDIPRNKKFGSNYWEAFSPKLNRIIKLYSDLEYDHWLLVESDPNIKEFCEQPLRIQNFSGKSNRQSIFDMWILYQDNSEQFLEIKYQSDLHKQRVKEQILTQQQWCLKNNKKYRIVTDREIRNSHIRLSNARLMISFLKNSCNNKSMIVHLNTVAQIIQLKHKITIKQLKESGVSIVLWTHLS
ncbi:Tn7 transposase TnsA N-terminal domain-containing protein [Ectobacillus antri]|uniref:Tn7 transposase TnsA N-terminal domain-containing protein n=1 Tax=Ectobacillus antri TaxID=2486280 RepID=A0ABT6H478_9BACI|nr:Tn7 transposase TnsA N-terminal domain-containing protein [Ectobacillus antri]MDG4657083.1 Tn7 transposase TnsA N-terminal domain-containing protein [Ectobacillus antri]MDG5754185.1 Tn7 transposase TnsA N-terminal domain-containing protein [Ectobacillus antri]